MRRLGQVAGWRHRQRRRIVRAVGVAVVGVLAAGCWWQQPGAGPGHARSNPFAHGLTAATVMDIEPQWSVTVAGDLSEPVTDADRVVATLVDAGNSSASVHAFDVGSGATAWQHALPPPGLSVSGLARPVAFAEGDLVVGSIARFPFGSTPCGDLTRLDPVSGAVRSVTNVEFPTSAVVAAGPYAVRTDSYRCVPGTGGRLIVEPSAGGEPLWSAGLSTEITTRPTVSLVDDRVYLVDRGSIAAYALAACAAPACDPVWTTARASFNSPVVATPGLMLAVENNEVPSSPDDPGWSIGAVSAFDAATGAEVWSAVLGDVGTHGLVTGMAADEDTLYLVGRRDSTTPWSLEAYPLDGCGLRECAPLWTAELDAPDRPVAWPAVAGDVVYVPSGDEIVALDAGGCPSSPCVPLAEIALPGPARHLSVSGGRVLVVTGDGTSTSTLSVFGLE